MATSSNCPCPNPTDEPDALCCPTDIELGNAVDVRDRTCKKRKIRPGTKGVLAAKNGKTGFLDGSEEQPINLDVEQKLANNGYVLIQDISGRLLAIKPDPTLVEANPVLQLVYKDGVWKAVPLSFNNQTIVDEEVPTVKSGLLTMLACAGEGLVRLGKFIPDCLEEMEDEEVRYLIIDALGNVSCDTIGKDECPEPDPVEELDSIIGCAGGVKTTLLPVLEKRLVVIDNGGPKFALADAMADITWFAAPLTEIYNYTVIGVAPSSQVATLNLTTVPGWDADFTEVMLDLHIEGIVQTADYSMNVDIDGIRGVRLDLTANLQAMSDSNSRWFKIVTPGSMALALTYNLSLAGDFNRFICTIKVGAFR